ncbi:MAG: carboxypeptidase-like regulatory domain-containing protein [Acidobacteria bacterium]|nr:carboxypeptidase-like regulatory domain-containing protein [Acidobacteriota bacterium]
MTKRHLFPLLLAPALLVAVPLLAQEQPVNAGADLRGGDVTGAVGGRDNTRVFGTILDSSGQPLSDVDIWLQNDNSPAARVRAKGRKTGTYLLRNMGRLYSRDDYEGIVLRITFERDGYRSVLTRVAVQRGGSQQVYPILFREGESMETKGVRTVLVGRVEDKRGKAVKGGGEVTITSGDGEFSAAGPIEKNGEFAVVLWDAPARVNASFKMSKGGERDEIIELKPSPLPDIAIAQFFNPVM